MNTAIILSGGNGERLGGAPKQYREVGGRPVIAYSLRAFQDSTCTDGIVIAARSEWRPFLSEWVRRDDIGKFMGFAPAGETRGHSIYNALKSISAEADDTVTVHDAARPFVSLGLIEACTNAAKNADGAMLAICPSDTIYRRENSALVSLNRDELLIGQTPECFKYGKYLAAFESLTGEEIANARGSTEIALMGGMDIVTVEGDAANFKITTEADFERFVMSVGERKL
jgi:2-C-methyl-D-erythritol 4-phosphate cytidylyltransferase